MFISQITKHIIKPLKLYQLQWDPVQDQDRECAVQWDPLQEDRECCCQVVQQQTQTIAENRDDNKMKVATSPTKNSSPKGNTNVDKNYTGTTRANSNWSNDVFLHFRNHKVFIEKLSVRYEY